MRAVSAALPRQNSVARARRSALSARRRLSSTVWLSNTVGFWNLRPMPSSAISLSSSLVRSVAPSNSTSPCCGPGLAGDDVHHGGLAGAVRADDGAHLAGIDGERQLVEGAEAVERNGDAVEIEQRRWWSRASMSDHSAGPRGSLTGSRASRDRACRACAATRHQCLDGADDAARQQQRDPDEQAAQHEQPVAARAPRW